MSGTTEIIWACGDKTNVFSIIKITLSGENIATFTLSNVALNI